MKFFGREPTLVIQTISAGMAILVAFGMPGLSAGQAALIVAVLNGALGAANALMVRPLAPAAFTGLVAACAALLGAYGFGVPQEAVGAISAGVIAVLVLLTRGQVSPVPAGSDRA
jgi:hypothetical protein